MKKGEEGKRRRGEGKGRVEAVEGDRRERREEEKPEMKQES